MPPDLELQYSYDIATLRDLAFDLRNLILAPFPNNLFNCAIAGSIRRKQQSPGDIDIVCGTTNQIVVDRAASLIDAKPFASKISGKFHGIPTQIWFCEPENWAPLLLEVTGPRDFNIFLRSRAQKQGLYLSNKGLFLHSIGGTLIRIDNNTEGNIIWTVLGKRWIPPEERY